MDTTLDGLLDRRVTLEQPAKGYRVAVDTVLLAAAVPAQAGESVLDLGCGVGGAMLCLGRRVPGISVTGIEIQPEFAEIGRRNIARNSFQLDMKIEQGDVTRLFENDSGGEGRRSSPPLEGGDRGGVGSAKTEDCFPGKNPPPNLPLKGGGIHAVLPSSFDHVLMNPPYHDEATHDVSPDASRRMANTEKNGELEQWIAAASRALKLSGILTLIHRADRRDEILAHVRQSFAGIEILPVAPKAAAPPSRVILRARKTGQAAVRSGKTLILHRAEGGYTDEAESILRHAKSMDFIEEMT